MSEQVIVISPEPSLAERLCEGLAAAGITDQPVVLAHYPAGKELRKLIDSHSRTVAAVLIDLSDRSQAFELIRELRDTHPDIPAVAADNSPSRTSFAGATEAGAWGYLVAPFDLEPLAEHFRNLSADNSDLGEGESPEEVFAVGDGRLLAFMPVQGGNGASTVAVHVADAIARKSAQRVLLVDFDFHSGTVAFRLQLKPKHTLAEALEDEDFSDESWRELVCPWNELDVLVAPPSNRSVLPESFDSIPEILASAMRVYPHVFVDLPCPIFSSSRYILKAADVVYLVCTPEITSLHLARRKAQEIRHLGVAADRIRLIVNRVGSWGSLQTNNVAKVVGVPVEFALDNDYAALREATWSGGLVPETSTLAEQFRQLGSRIMDEVAVRKAS